MWLSWQVTIWSCVKLTWVLVERFLSWNRLRRGWLFCACLLEEWPRRIECRKKCETLLGGWFGLWKNKAKNEIQAVPLRRVHVCRVTNSIRTDLLLGKHFDAIAHNVDSALVWGVQLQNSVLPGSAEQDTGQTEDCSGLANTWKSPQKSIHKKPPLFPKMLMFYLGVQL